MFQVAKDRRDFPQELIFTQGILSRGKTPVMWVSQRWWPCTGFMPTRLLRTKLDIGDRLLRRESHREGNVAHAVRDMKMTLTKTVDAKTLLS